MMGQVCVQHLDLSSRELEQATSQVLEKLNYSMIP